MATTFVVEDGSGLSNSNALISVSEADQITENYGNDSDWSGATNDDKEDAIRQATRYMNYHYKWNGYKSVDTQACQWPRIYIYDEDDYAIDSDVIPDRVKEACAYLALKVVKGDTLLPDFDDESKVKREKKVIGPLTTEKEYVLGESPDKSYTVADRLVAPFVVAGSTDGEYAAIEIDRG